MSDKPLKTVDSILQQLAYKARLSAYSPGYIKMKERPVETAEAKADLYQLMLSLKPHKKNIDYRDGYKGNKVNEARSEGYNQAIADFQAKLSEHFNGEGKV